MTTEIISIGDELLIGQVINTNASWMAVQLNDAGAEVRQISCVSDAADEIQRALREAEQRADLILMTGGLGPTHDDITKDVLCRYFDTHLVMNDRVLENITSFFQRKGLPLTQLNKDQALVPEAAIVIDNPVGTAPGLAFRKNEKLYVAMPGVPYEMKHIIQTFVLPYLQKNGKGEKILHKTILTQGIGESFLAVKIADWVTALPSTIKLAYLPSPGIVRLRLSIRGNQPEEMMKLLSEEAERLKTLIPDFFWGMDDEKLEAQVGKMLREKVASLSTAESCTGGYIAHKITSVPGSSTYFKGSVIAYDNRVKEEQLGVSKQLLQDFGAVSSEVVEKMAEGVKNLLKTDYAIAVSGIAGPDGGTPEKPVGTVWVAVAGPDGTVSKKFLFGDERERNIVRAGTAALGMLRNQLLA